MAHPAVYVISFAVGLSIVLYTYFTHHNIQAYRETRNHNGSNYDDFEINKVCTICFENISQLHRQKLNCGHNFHKKCISKWNETSVFCPNCRSNNC